MLVRRKHMPTHTPTPHKQQQKCPKFAHTRQARQHQHVCVCARVCVAYEHACLSVRQKVVRHWRHTRRHPLDRVCVRVRIYVSHSRILARERIKSIITAPPWHVCVFTHPQNTTHHPRAARRITRCEWARAFAPTDAQESIQ